MKLRVVPIALAVALSGGVPGLIAATTAPAAAATAAYTMTDLGNLGGGVSMGFGINSGGEVVGRSYLNKVFFFKCGRHICHFTQNDPFSWSAGTMTDLGTFGAMSVSEATAVNSTGDVVGGSNGHAFLVHNGKMTDLGPGEATGINDAGEIVGNSQGAFLISGGTRTTLPGLSSYGGGSFSSASGINHNHQIVGASDDASGNSHAVMWSNGTITDLGTFGLDPVGEAINNHGVIVGQSSTGAWIWSNGTFQSLNNLIPPGSGFTLTDATAINDNGQIVAN